MNFNEEKIESYFRIRSRAIEVLSVKFKHHIFDSVHRQRGTMHISGMSCKTIPPKNGLRR